MSPPGFSKHGPCLVDGCSYRRQARGWCTTHYDRWRRTGDPGPVFHRSCADCGLELARKSKRGSWPDRCPPCAKTHQRQRNKEWFAARPGYASQRSRELKYGLTDAAFRSMMAGQSHRCAICETDRPGARDWHVDHDHVTGRVRGILCRRCNWLLGTAGDNTTTLRAAADYLVKAQIQSS